MKAEMLFFTNLIPEAPRRPPEALFWYEILKFFKIFKKNKKSNHASAHDCPRFQPFFDVLTDFSVKSLVFNIFLRFFSSDSWDVAFPKNEKGGSKGGSPEVVFWFEKAWFFENFKKKSKLLTKIQPRMIPLLIPIFHFWKKQHLSFHWKKIVKKY